MTVAALFDMCSQLARQTRRSSYCGDSKGIAFFL
jgi:hypothetical protein